MTSITKAAAPLLLCALFAGCTTTETTNQTETFMGQREQKMLLAKARPAQDFNLSPSFPFGNNVLYLGGTRLEPNQSETQHYAPHSMPLIKMQGPARQSAYSALVNTALSVSWMQYSCAAPADCTFLSNNGEIIPYFGTESTEGANAYAGLIPELHIGAVNLNNTPLFIRMARGPMTPAAYSATRPKVDAVLGWDNLRQFQFIQFDPAQGEITISTSSTSYVPNEERLIGKAAISPGRADKLTVLGAISGQEAQIILDFAGDFAFARADTRDPVTKQVDLGEIVYLDVATEVLAAQDRFPRAGRKLLEKFVVTVCPRDGVVYFERPEGI